ncbi:MAG TPA: galactose-1-phosphate uridylyltransferase [Candidatus Binataceae bacterium]|nr:galactose-1-phosphate uridylyltransferase [Candidatus Binataceae bacterium]
MPELRKDPVVGRWVIMATERARRPSDFSRQAEERKGGPCVFCPGMEHLTPPEVLAYRDAGSRPNNPGWRVRGVPNRFPALRIEGGLGRRGEGMYDLMNGVGAHEVLIESPDHDRMLADEEPAQIEEIFHAYRERVIDLQRDERFRYVIIFKNHGAEAGASLEHPHSQLIALPILPLSVQAELRGASAYFALKERCIFCDMVEQESVDRRRLVDENPSFITVCPFAARFPFEMWIVPRVHGSHFEHASDGEYRAFAYALKAALGALKAALGDPPFNYIIHSAPVGEAARRHYHWHMEITPALTKVAGFEVGTGFHINPVPPEFAAGFLRDEISGANPAAAVASTNGASSS